MTRRISFFSILALLGFSATAAAQQPAPPSAEAMHVVEASTLAWDPLELPGFDAGLALAVVQGDPGKAEPYTIRLKFPDGYVFPAHHHPNAENLTVLTGRFLLGHGAEPNDAELKPYVPGDYLYIPGRNPHFGRVEGETIIQLHGIGPFDVTLAQPGSGAQR